MNAKALLFLCVGAAAGSAVTWFLTKKHYEKRAQEEIDSVKAFYAEKTQKEETPDANEAEPEESNDTYDGGFQSIRFKNEKPDIMSYYEALSKEKEEEKEERIGPMEEPYIISPDEYGEIPDYDPITLTYYADGVLADENNEMIEEDDAEESVGTEFMDHFGEYEEDVVYIRNDMRYCDYEILRDVRTYEESREFMPRRVEVE